MMLLLIFILNEITMDASCDLRIGPSIEFAGNSDATPVLLLAPFVEPNEFSK